MEGRFDFESAEFLTRRMNFLIARAGARSEETEGSRRDRIGAASLLMEAASVALIGGEVERATMLLKQSAEILIGERVAFGLLLSALISSPNDQEWLAKRIGDFGADLFSTLGGDRRTDHLAANWVDEPMQLLIYWIAAQIAWEDRDAGPTTESVRTLLQPYTAMELPGGKVMQDYLDLMKIGPIDDVFAALSRIKAAWRVRIDAARKDEYHWKRLISPAELIDFKLVGLTVVLLRRHADKLDWRFLSERGGIERLPFETAVRLADLNRPMAT